jgi:hypothetical protein
MEDNFDRRGGCIGFAIAFAMTFVFLLSALLWEHFSRRQGDQISFWEVGGIAAVAMLISCTIGIPLGQSAATYPTANAAFLRPALVVLGMGLALSAIFFVSMIWTRDAGRIGLWVPCWLTPVTAAIISLQSGLTAIYLRDYRQFRRTRLIPQFTLLELLVVFALFACIISAAKSITMFMR